jgi:hypothetical protein
MTVDDDAHYASRIDGVGRFTRPRSAFLTAAGARAAAD